MTHHRRSVALMIMMIIGALSATLVSGTSAAASPARAAALPLITSAAAPNKAGDLGAIITLAEAQLSAVPVGTGPGQVPTSAVSTFQSAIDAAKTVAADPSGDHEGQINSLVGAGATFLGSAAISADVVDANRNRLAYSTFRRDLTILIWQSKAALATDPELHTQAAKDTLQDQIDRSQAALSGHAEVPFARNRGSFPPARTNPSSSPPSTTRAHPATAPAPGVSSRPWPGTAASRSSPTPPSPPSSSRSTTPSSTPPHRPRPAERPSR